MSLQVIGQCTWPDGCPRSSGNAFDILYMPRAVPRPHAAPKSKPNPSKVQQAARALMTDAERQAARILRDNSRLAVALHGSSAADRAKTARLVGKKNSARSQ